MAAVDPLAAPWEVSLVPELGLAVLERVGDAGADLAPGRLESRVGGAVVLGDASWRCVAYRDRSDVAGAGASGHDDGGEVGGGLNRQRLAAGIRCKLYALVIAGWRWSAIAASRQPSWVDCE
jgi:hypothetical protein